MVLRNVRAHCRNQPSPSGPWNSETAFDMTVMGASSKLNSEFGVQRWRNWKILLAWLNSPEELAHDDQSNGDDLIKPSQKRRQTLQVVISQTLGLDILTVKAPKESSKRDDFAEIAQAEEVTSRGTWCCQGQSERATVKAKAKLAKIELEKEKLVVERERRREKVEARQMKMRFMGGSDQQHGTSACLNMHLRALSSRTPLLDHHHAYALAICTGISYYCAHLSPVSFQDGNSASHPCWVHSQSTPVTAPLICSFRTLTIPDPLYQWKTVARRTVMESSTKKLLLLLLLHIHFHPSRSLVSPTSLPLPSLLCLNRRLFNCSLRAFAFQQTQSTGWTL